MGEPGERARILGSERALSIAVGLFVVAIVGAIGLGGWALSIGFSNRTTIRQVIHPSKATVEAGISGAIASLTPGQVQQLLLKLTPAQVQQLQRERQRRARRRNGVSPSTPGTTPGSSSPTAPGSTPRRRRATHGGPKATTGPAAPTPRPPATPSPAPMPVPPGAGPPAPPVPPQPPTPGRPICLLGICLPPLL